MHAPTTGLIEKPLAYVFMAEGAAHEEHELSVHVAIVWLGNLEQV